MDLRLGREEVEGTHWRILSDVSITIVLMMVVYLVLQFVSSFRERYIWERLAARQREVSQALHQGGVDTSSFHVDSVAPDRQRITFRSELLFETCRADLRPEGERVLRAVGQVLQARKGYLEAVQVEGHTDVAPIRGAGPCPYATNWELSSARATSVVLLFASAGLVDNPKLSAIGRSEYHPVDTIQLAPNRRIELLLQYDRREVEHELTRERAIAGP